MRIFLVPVGEQIDPLYEGFKYGGDVDLTVFVCTEKTLSKAKELEQWAKKISDVRIVETVANDIGKIMDDIVNTVPEIIVPDIQVISNLSGGTKPMSFACYILTSLRNGYSFYIFLRDDKKMEYITMPKLNMCVYDVLNIKNRGSKARIKIMEAVESGYKKLGDISKKLTIRKPAILRHIRKLEKLGLVNYNEAQVSLTETGKLIVKMIKITKDRFINKIS